MTHTNIRLNAATEARVRQAASGVVLTTMIFPNAVQTATLGVFVGFAGLPIARSEEPVPTSNTKLKRLLAEAMLDNAALQDLQPVPPSRAISDEGAMKRIFSMR